MGKLINSMTEVGAAQHNNHEPNSLADSIVGNNEQPAPDVQVAIKIQAAQDEPATRVNVSFVNVNYTVPLPDGSTKQILHNVHGLVECGQLTALMGPSGAGKSTVLDILAGRKSVGQIEGEILYAGASLSASKLKRMVGYVEQSDTLVPELTVRQMMLYAAAFKLTTNGEDRAARVDEIIAQLGLESCKDTKIGDTLNRGISGGEAKRVNIGLSLIPSPPVMFLDEPTTGLDSHIANEVVAILTTLAKDRAVICTIHSPTARSFNLFNQVLMLKDGRNIYSGRVTEIAQYFSNLGCTPRASDASLVEWVVEVTSAKEDANNNLNLSPQYTKSIGNAYEKRLANIAARKTSAWDDEKSRIRKPSLCHSIFSLIRNRGVSMLKDPNWISPRVMEKIFLSVFSTMIFWDVGDKSDAANIQSTVGAVLSRGDVWIWCSGVHAGSYSRQTNLLPGAGRRLLLSHSLLCGKVPAGSFCGCIHIALLHSDCFPYTIAAG